MSKKKIISLIVAILVVAGVVGWTAYELKTSTVATKISQDEAEETVNKEFDEMAVSEVGKYIAEKNNIKVNNMTYGDEKNIILECSVETVDAYSAIYPELGKFLGTDKILKHGTMQKSSTDYLIDFEPGLLELMNNAKTVNNDVKVELYDTENGYVAYAEPDVIDSIYGGLDKLAKEVSQMKTYKDAGGAEVEIRSKNINLGFIECISLRAETTKPETATGLLKTWNKLKSDFYTNFIEYDRWKTIFKGLGVTLKLTFFALLIGIFIGFLVAFVRCTYIKKSKRGILLKIINAICQTYLTIIRGTPVVVQIMIIYFVIFMPMGMDKFIAAVICFGLNSGAYVAEIVRGGIMSIDEGQTEAGRSLGFGYMPTMFYIVFPQAFKAVLPALANEFVVLLKETSIAFYIGLGDLMYSVNAIRAATYTPFMPLIAAAVIYFIMVLGLSKLVGVLERRLRNNER